MNGSVGGRASVGRRPGDQLGPLNPALKQNTSKLIPSVVHESRWGGGEKNKIMSQCVKYLLIGHISCLKNYYAKFTFSQRPY